MSSRILSPDDPRGGRIVWRQVGAAAPPVSAGEGKADQSAQKASLQKEHEQRVAAARSAGFAEGEASGRKRATGDLQPVLERLARSIEDLGQLRARLRREAEGDMLRLALAIARRVLRREMAVDPDAMHGLVLGALEKLQGQEICRVRVHPSHAAQLSDWLRPASGQPGVEVIADSSRNPGDVIFETDRGNLDASVDTQLGEIERGLADCLRRNT
jgi:flagellar assembly protein FliH